MCNGVSLLADPQRLLNCHNIMQLAENGNDIALVFFHLFGAFDSVLHQPLLEKFLSLVSLTSSSSLVLYADDILLYKPISYQADYAQLQLDIDAIHLRVNRCHLMLNSSKC